MDNKATTLKPSDRLYQLIDRLQKYSEWKRPERKWSNEFYYYCAFEWVGKESELEARLLRLEGEMKEAGAL